MASATRPLAVSVLADIGVAVSKLVCGTLSASSVMLAEGAHSLADAGNGALLLLGRRLARRPATRRHPFGHGKEVYFWSLVVSMLIFVGGGGFSLVEGVWRLGHPGRLDRAWPSYVVLAVAALFDGFSLWVALREFATYRREKRYGGGLVAAIQSAKDPSIFMIVVEDAAALLGVVIAFGGVYLSHLLSAPRVDAAASLGVALVLMLAALFLGWECRALVLGESARPEIVDDARRVVRSDAGVAALQGLKTLQLGPRSVLVVARVAFAPELRAPEIAAVSRRITAQLRQLHDSICWVTFEPTA
jgi:cation diffusion facilitator family transporter